MKAVQKQPREQSNQTLFPVTVLLKTWNTREKHQNKSDRKVNAPWQWVHSLLFYWTLLAAQLVFMYPFQGFISQASVILMSSPTVLLSSSGSHPYLISNTFSSHQIYTQWSLGLMFPQGFSTKLGPMFWPFPNEHDVYQGKQIHLFK